MADLFAKILEINLREANSEVRLELGEFFKKNPEWDVTAMDDDTPEFIDADPRDEDAEFLPAGRTILLPFDQFDAPSAGDYVRIDVVSH